MAQEWKSLRTLWTWPSTTLYINDLGYEYRFHGLRFFVATTVQIIRGNVAQLRMAMSLLARRKPQPNVREQDLTIGPGTQARIRRLLLELLHPLGEAAPEWNPNLPLDENNVIPRCGPATELAIDIMQFLETGEYDFRDSEATPPEEVHANGTVDKKQALTLTVATRWYLPWAPVYRLSPPPLPGAHFYHLTLPLAVDVVRHRKKNENEMQEVVLEQNLVMQPDLYHLPRTTPQPWTRGIQAQGLKHQPALRWPVRTTLAPGLLPQGDSLRAPGQQRVLSRVTAMLLLALFPPPPKNIRLRLCQGKDLTQTNIHFATSLVPDSPPCSNQHSSRLWYAAEAENRCGKTKKARHGDYIELGPGTLPRTNHSTRHLKQIKKLFY